MPRAPYAIAALLAVVAPAAASAAVQGSVGIASGVDTNPRRTVGETSAEDGQLLLTGSLRGRHQPREGHAFGWRYDLGLKKHWSTLSEDVAAQQLDLDYARRFGALTLGTDGALKLRLSRGGSRDYADGSAGAFLEGSLLSRVTLRLSAGARAFTYRPNRDYDSLGPQVGLATRAAITRRHGLTGGASLAAPFFRGFARTMPAGQPSPLRRRDTVYAAWANYGYRGPVALQAGYLFAANASNSFGEGASRHRISGAATAGVLANVFVSMQAAYQFIRWTDGIFLTNDLLLLDDEAQSSIAAKLSWAMTGSLDLELRYGLFWIHLPPKSAAPEAVSLEYLRQLASAGLTWRF